MKKKAAGNLKNSVTPDIIIYYALPADPERIAEEPCKNYWKEE